MYKCGNCGETGSEPLTVYEKDGGSIQKCRRCGSENILHESVSCDICGVPMFEGERAYEAGNMLICRKCVSEVLI